MLQVGAGDQRGVFLWCCPKCLADVPVSAASAPFRGAAGALPPDRQGWDCFIPCLAGSSKDLGARWLPRTQESKRIKGPSADHIYFII